MKRQQINDKYKWHLNDMVASDEAFESEFAAVDGLLPKLAEYQGRLGDRDSALACLKLESEIGKRFGLIYVYSHMLSHGDVSDSYAVGLAGRTDALMGRLATADAFVTSELCALPDDVLDSYINDPEFKDFDFMLKENKRQKAHILSDKEERLIAMATDFLGTPENVASMLMDADLKFDPVKKDGKKIELTNVTYGELIASSDRKIRKQAFDNLYAGYAAHINTFAANYAGSVKADNFCARVRNFDNCLERSMQNDNVPTAVYENLIAAVTKNIKPLHRYMDLRKKLLGVKALHMYDVYAPVIDDAEIKLEYEDACELVKKALAPMGEDYVALLNRAMTEGWIDVMPNDGKRGGAYSWGAYGAHPYVMLNYSKTTNNIFVIAHELGHCMHSYLSQSTQPYEKHAYQIFVAEVASICNETLLEHYLMTTTDDDKLKRYLLGYRLDRFRTTLFRQAMFAEFEYEAHKADLEGRPLTVEYLNDLYLGLNKKYYGEKISDETIKYEWSRVPHFYSAFYVYKYATGITAATSIANKILTEPGYVELYKEKFLRAGGSKAPYDILRDVKIDLATEQPYKDAFKMFNDTIDELKKLG